MILSAFQLYSTARALLSKDPLQRTIPLLHNNIRMVSKLCMQSYVHMEAMEVALVLEKNTPWMMLHTEVVTGTLFAYDNNSCLDIRAQIVGLQLVQETPTRIDLISSSSSVPNTIDNNSFTSAIKLC